MFVMIDPTDEELRDAYRPEYLGWNDPRNRIIAYVIGSAIGITLLAHEGGELPGLVSIVIAFFVTAALEIISHFRSREKKLTQFVKRMRIAMRDDAARDGQVLFDFDANGISLSAGWKRDSIKWPAVKSWRETPAIFVINGMVIPKRAITPDRITALRSELTGAVRKRWRTTI